MRIEEIKGPEFLKEMNQAQLEQLCCDLRTFIIKNVSQTGGHLSPNLGVVELTVALHRVFQSPRDKLIFDVGHQCYTHKILTGRAERFHTLRQLDGISGFQCRGESLHDCYEGGHSSTSLSAALGFAMARDMAGEDTSVVAVIGDGSMGNGMSYEALNHIGDYQKPLIVVLNDNEMSISRNVGALHNSLEQIRINSSYSKTKSITKTTLSKLPVIGKPMVSFVENAKGMLKKLYLKNTVNGALFEDLGFNYYGPIDGHDLGELEAYLKVAKKSPRPVLLHVITQKGKGYEHCLDDSDGRWHGVGAFDAQSGIFPKKPGVTGLSQVVSGALSELARQDKDILAITPAMATGAKLLKFQREFPNRFIDAGMAEEHALVMANALALSGKKPFVSIYSTFLQRGYDQVVHDIARMQGGVVIGVDRCGIIGEDGVSHQGIYDVSLFLPVPGVMIAHGKDAAETTQLLATAFAGKKPFMLRYSKNPLPVTQRDLTPLPIGSWEKLCEGRDAMVITYGDFVGEALQAKEQLKTQGIDIGVINARFLKPIDHIMYQTLLKEGKPLFVYEEATEAGSLGSYLLLEAARLGFAPNMTVAGVPDEFIPHGDRCSILHRLRLDAQGLCSRINNKLKK
ncbi:MAG: 1-deoxy-D-xylulose-5-phosphate synthase [Angelakisella sp.]|nr:1-deoxy-D-xylulose-5-phosphate synthase [Angelakisella sp.]